MKNTLGCTHQRPPVRESVGRHAMSTSADRLAHPRVRAARIGLISISGVILVFASISLILAPKPLV